MPASLMISNMCFSNAGTPEEEEEFFLELTGNKRIIPITKEGESDEAHDQILSLNLYRYLDTILFYVFYVWKQSKRWPSTQLLFHLKYGNITLTTVSASLKETQLTLSIIHSTVLINTFPLPSKKKIIARSPSWTPWSFARTIHSLLRFIEKQLIPIGIWISTPIMTNDTRSVQLRLYYIVQLISQTRNKEKRLNLLMSPML